MQWFKKNAKGILTPIEKGSFKLKKNIQSLVEQNMDALLGLEFVSSGFAVGEFRLDSLAYDLESKSFVIVEYKKGSNSSVVDQGFSYLSAMLENKADFILEYNEKMGRQLKRSEIDWESSRVIFISQSFNKFQKNSVNFKDFPFELYEIRQFEDGLIALEQHLSNSNESMEKLSPFQSDSAMSEVSDQVKVPSEDDHTEKFGGSLKPLWDLLKERLEEYPDTSFSTTKVYISWKRGKAHICHINPRKSDIFIVIYRGNIKESGEKSKRYFTVDDPKRLAKEGTRTFNNKDGVGYTYKISLKKPEQLDYVMFLLEQKYNSMK